MQMKRLLPVLMGFALLLLFSTEGWCGSVPLTKEDFELGHFPGVSRCVGSPSVEPSPLDSWHHCVGIYTYAHGWRFVGEYKNGLPNGRGTVTFGAQGRRAVDK